MLHEEVRAELREVARYQQKADDDEENPDSFRHVLHEAAVAPHESEELAHEDGRDKEGNGKAQ